MTHFLEPLCNRAIKGRVKLLLWDSGLSISTIQYNYFYKYIDSISKGEKLLVDDNINKGVMIFFVYRFLRTIQFQHYIAFDTLTEATGLRKIAKLNAQVQ